MREAFRAALIPWALSLGLLSVGAMSPSAAAAQDAEQTDGGAEPASEAAPAPAVYFEDWVIASGDHGDLPFMIIDKAKAEVLVFGADGQLRGATPALLGLGRGDDSTPGIGNRKISTIPPDERTTPAGRFVAGFGKARGEENVLWVDYENAVSLHAVISASPKERRVARLRSPTPEDNRITYGCINVPTSFYQEVVLPAFKGTNGVVYVLPETKPLEEVFPAYRPQERTLARTQTAAAEPSTSALEASTVKASAIEAEDSAVEAEVIATAPGDATRRNTPD